MAKTKVCVIFGGVTTEYEVSLKSSTSVINNIPRDKYDVVMVGITKQGRWLFFPGSTDDIIADTWFKHPDCVPCFLSPDRTTKGLVKLENSNFYIEKIDVLLPVLHGKNGEDGTIQGLFELSGIPYCGCKVLSSSNCMDKIYANMIFDQNNIARCKWDYMFNYDLENFDEIEKRVSKKLGYPIFVKPSNSGSSVGISKVSNKSELKKAVNLALAHDNEVVFEEFIEGHEVECAIFGNVPNIVASEVGEIGASAEFYDYDDKYNSGTSELYIPARLDKNVREEIQRLAKKAFTVLKCSGLSRVDFFVTSSNKILINEINTFPGFTNISMYPKLMIDSGMTYAELVDGIIQLGLYGKYEK